LVIHRRNRSGKVIWKSTRSPRIFFHWNCDHPDGNYWAFECALDYFTVLCDSEEKGTDTLWWPLFISWPLILSVQLLQLKCQRMNAGISSVNLFYLR